jgi:hypothetical protein
MSSALSLMGDEDLTAVLPNAARPDYGREKLPGKELPEASETDLVGHRSRKMQLNHEYYYYNSGT